LNIEENLRRDHVLSVSTIIGKKLRFDLSGSDSHERDFLDAAICVTSTAAD
jgi:hypothetical protein